MFAEALRLATSVSARVRGGDAGSHAALGGPACGLANRVVLYCAGVMDDSGPFSNRVSERLRRAGLGPLAATLLEAVGPLSLVAAQLGYLVEPLVGRPEVGELSRLLEHDDQLSDLVRSLRGEEP
jgi:hypothetical protein